MMLLRAEKRIYGGQNTSLIYNCLLIFQAEHMYSSDLDHGSPPRSAEKSQWKDLVNCLGQRQHDLPVCKHRVCEFQYSTSGSPLSPLRPRKNVEVAYPAAEHILAGIPARDGPFGEKRVIGTGGK